MRLRSQNEHRIPHTDGSRDAGMESSENASIFKTQECHWFRLKRYLCSQRLFVSVQQKDPVWGLLLGIVPHIPILTDAYR